MNTMKKLLLLLLFGIVIYGCEKIPEDAYYKIRQNNFDAEFVYGVEYDINGNVLYECGANVGQYGDVSHTYKAHEGAVSVGIRARINRQTRYSVATYSLVPGDTILVKVGNSWR